jgi:hypothetical protein
MGSDDKMNRCHCDTHANKPQLLTSPHERGENKKSHLAAKSTFSLFILIKKHIFLRQTGWRAMLGFSSYIYSQEEEEDYRH